MPAAKMETAAEKYRRIKQERILNAELFDLETPSGMTWKLRRPQLDQFLLAGTMPLSLASKVAEQQQHGASTDDVAQTLDASEVVQGIKFMGDLVRYCAVSPRIVDAPRAGEDEIGVAEVELDDFYAILAWAKTQAGGGQAETLDSFRSK